MNYFLAEEISIAHFLQYKYFFPKDLLVTLPLPDENCVATWQNICATASATGLANALQIISDKFIFDEVSQTNLWLETTVVGKIPVLFTSNSQIFIYLVEVFSSQNNLKIPDTVNAFTIKINLPVGELGHIIVLRQAGYSSVTAKVLSLGEQDWLAKSQLIRLHHECTHYFLWRLTEVLSNHPLDELIADCIGQIRAMGSFSADLQRKFFGLDTQGKYTGGRLIFYCSEFSAEGVSEICHSINLAINNLELFLNINKHFLQRKNEPKLIMLLAQQGLSNISKNIFYDNTCQVNN